MKRSRNKRSRRSPPAEKRAPQRPSVVGPGPVELEVVLPMDQAGEKGYWKAAAARSLGIDPDRIHEVRLLRKSIDSRQREIKFQLRLEVGIECDLPPVERSVPPRYQIPESAPEVIIIGCGPAGMFAALRCLELGCRPILLERGKDASKRRYDLAPILRRGEVIEDSNYCFGEGGAGTFSDGKLYTRATKRGPVRMVYEMLVAHGAPEQILIDAHPHIGSNLLPKVVMALRESIRAGGGEVHFQTKVTSLVIDEQRIAGVQTADGRQWAGRAVILATGHSARDIYRLLAGLNIGLEAKDFAAGVRIEHPQPHIDQLQYHLAPGEPRPDPLPAASYRLAATIHGRGVHSFCMCPGGFIVPAATENDEVVVNGMSLSKRDSPFANSGLVVSVNSKDWEPELRSSVLGGMLWQKRLEQAAKQAGGGGQVAPAQRVADFLAGRRSENLPSSSYFPGLNSVRLDQLLPGFMVEGLRLGLRRFEEGKPGYLHPEALLVGVETRTSSPVRIPRDAETLQHPQVGGLWPCGEGAGYAGGIVSAALDGLRCAEAAARVLRAGPD